MKYLNARWNRGAAGLLLIVISIIQGVRFGIDILQVHEDGNALFLGGPSLWYATALFPTIIGVVYLISWMISIGRVEIINSGGFLRISEKKIVSKQLVTLPIKKISVIHVSNTILRWDALGVIPLVLSAYWLMIDAISLLSYHAVFSMGIVTGRYYLFQTIGNILAVLLILFCGSVKVVIRSTEIDRVIIHYPFFFGRLGRKETYQQLKKTLGIKSEKLTRAVRCQLGLLTGYGLLLLVISTVSRIFNLFSSEPLRIFYIFAGLGFLTYGIKLRSIGYKKGWWDSGSSKPEKPRKIPKLVVVGIIIVILSTCFSAIHNLINLPWETTFSSLWIANIGFSLMIMISGIYLIVFIAKG